MGDAIFLELAQGVVVGLGFGDAPGALKDLAVVEVEEGVQAVGPVLHGHGDVAAGPGFGQVEEGVDQPAQVLQLGASEVVLADDDIAGQDLAVRTTRPGGQAHVGLIGVSPGADEFGSGLAVDGVVQLVLHGGEEAPGRRGVTVVVDAGGVDVGDLLVEAPLGQADLADLLQQALEVVLAQEAAVLHARPVDDVAPDGKVAQHLSGPLAELSGPHRVDPVTNRDDGIEVVVVDAARHLPGALGSNYPESPDSCLPLQLAGGKNVAQVLADGAHIDVEQLSHQLLRQPDRLVLVPRLNAAAPVLRREDQELSRGVTDQPATRIGLRVGG